MQVYVLEVEELSVPSPITKEEKEEDQDQREDETNVVVGSGKKWKVYRRFSQFKELHTKVIHSLVVPKNKLRNEESSLEWRIITANLIQ